MGKTISFVATDELAEWIEEESERRMTSVSSTAQQLLAERYHMAQDDQEEESADPAESEEEDESAEEKTDSAKSEVEEEEPDEEEDDGEDLPEVFSKHSDKWYRPDSDRGMKFTVRMPEDSGTARKNYKTVEGAAERLREEYE